MKHEKAESDTTSSEKYYSSLPLNGIYSGSKMHLLGFPVQTNSPTKKVSKNPNPKNGSLVYLQSNANYASAFYPAKGDYITGKYM